VPECHRADLLPLDFASALAHVQVEAVELLLNPHSIVSPCSWQQGDGNPRHWKRAMSPPSLSPDVSLARFPGYTRDIPVPTISVY
jgi:hypothetical protein